MRVEATRRLKLYNMFSHFWRQGTSLTDNSLIYSLNYVDKATR